MRTKTINLYSIFFIFSIIIMYSSCSQTYNKVSNEFCLCKNDTLGYYVYATTGNYFKNIEIKSDKDNGYVISLIDKQKDGDTIIYFNNISSIYNVPDYAHNKKVYINSIHFKPLSKYTISNLSWRNHQSYNISFSTDEQGNVLTQEHWLSDGKKADVSKCSCL